MGGEQLDVMARILAVGMRDSLVRAGVRDAMRRSPFSSHKIVLGDFLATEAGQALAESASRALNIVPSRIVAMATELPAMSLVVARRHDRLTWTGHGDIEVAATADNDAVPPRAFAPDGSDRPFNLAGVAVLFVLEPLETLYRRVRPQPDISGRVIQDSSDGEGGGLIRRYDANGHLLSEIQLADLPQAGVAYSGIQIDTTFIKNFKTNAGGEPSLEIEITARFYDANNNLKETQVFSKDDVNINEYQPWNDAILGRRIRQGSGDYIILGIIEDDAFNDDELGTRYFFVGDNDQERGVEGEGTNFTWLTLQWTPKIWVPSSGGTTYSATISGTSEGKPGNTCNWIVDTNVPDAVIEWRIGSEFLDSDTELVRQLGSSSFTLELQAWNSTTGAGATATFNVAVGSHLPNCLLQ